METKKWLKLKKQRRQLCFLENHYVYLYIRVRILKATGFTYITDTVGSVSIKRSWNLKCAHLSSSWQFPLRSLSNYLLFLVDLIWLFVDLILSPMWFQDINSFHVLLLLGRKKNSIFWICWLIPLMQPYRKPTEGQFFKSLQEHKNWITTLVIPRLPLTRSGPLKALCSSVWGFQGEGAAQTKQAKTCPSFIWDPLTVTLHAVHHLTSK